MEVVASGDLFEKGDYPFTLSLSGFLEEKSGVYMRSFTNFTTADDDDIAAYVMCVC